MDAVNLAPASLSPRAPRLLPAVPTAVAAGVIMAAGLPPLAGTAPLVPLALAFLFLVLATCERPGRTAWLFGLVHQAAVLHWLFLLEPSKTIPTRALVPVQALAAIVYVSVFYLGLGWVVGRLRTRFGARRTLLLLPVVWTAMEALRSRGELGFPWCLSGSAVIGTPALGLVRAAGEIGVGAALALTATGIALLLWRWLDGTSARITGRTLVLTAAATVALWVFLVAGARVEPAPPAAHARWADSLGTTVDPVPVAAVQADVALTDKWEKSRIDSTRIPYGELTRRAGRDGAELIVWAETAVPAYLRYDADLLKWLRETVRASGAWLYTGFPDADRGPDGTVRTYNSSGLFDPQAGQRASYAKHHLLPIGESIPFQSVLPFLAKVNLGQAEWTPGAAPGPMAVALDGGGLRISGLVCFESVFGALARESVRRGSQCLVVITNDGWFGQSAGPRQHAWLARLRAAECGVPVVRCANNGISFIADDRGRILDSLGLGQRGLVRAEIMPGAGRTLYVRAGSWPVAAFLAAWFLAVALGAAGKEES